MILCCIICCEIIENDIKNSSLSFFFLPFLQFQGYDRVL